MKDEHQMTLALIGIIFGLFVIVGGIYASVSWYHAKLQSEVYRRQGIEISQWEVFCGVEPAERVVQIKESKP